MKSQNGYFKVGDVIVIVRAERKYCEQCHKLRHAFINDHGVIICANCFQYRRPPMQMEAA